MKRTFRKYSSSYVNASETSGAAMRRKQKEALQEAELLATDGTWELWTPHTFKASCALGRMGGYKAKWDICYEPTDLYYNQWTKRGPLYIFINKADPSEKYAYQESTHSFYDENDRVADFDSFICQHPTFADYFNIDCDVTASNYVNASEANWWTVTSSDEIIEAISEYLEIPISIATIFYNYYTLDGEDIEVFEQFVDLEDFLENLYDDIEYIVDDMSEPERSQVLDALEK